MINRESPEIVSEEVVAYTEPAPIEPHPEAPVAKLAISIQDIRKRYSAVQALDGVTFEVEEGEFFGFLGPNGAGKTTTINALMGLAKLDEGEISIFGFDTVRDWREARRQVGLAPQEYNFDRYLSIRDMLIYQAGYFGLKSRDVSARADELLERFSLTSKAYDPYTRLSGGMKRRLTLARALIHSPRLLVLDEPTAGVDVELRLELWELLRELNRDGMTIFLTTHYLDEAESLCRRIAIIDEGKIKALEPTQRLLDLAGSTMLTITVDRPLRSLPPEFADMRVTFTPGTRVIALEGVPPAGLSGVLFALENIGFMIEDVTFARPSLQEVFLKMTQRRPSS